MFSGRAQVLHEDGKIEEKEQEQHMAHKDFGASVPTNSRYLGRLTSR